MHPRTPLIVALSTMLLAPAAAAGQQPARDTVDARPRVGGIALRLRRDSLQLPRLAPLEPLGRLAPAPLSAEYVADVRARALQRDLETSRRALWGEVVAASLAAGTAADSATRRVAAQPTGPQADTSQARRGNDILGPHADLGLQLQSRLEAKAQREKNERCTAVDFLAPASNCRGTIQPEFDFQFGVRSGGVVADRVHVNVDYDSQREFDASNNISVYYQGREDEILHRLEVGNVSFHPPPSRFITGGIPSGNYGLQAVGQIGPMSFRGIYAQQKGNVVKDRVFTVGDRTVQSQEREIEDYQIERRRFFWVIDPERFLAARFPNIDILDRDLATLAAQIPAGERPRRVQLYRYRPPSLTGSAARDINGPYAVTRFARSAGEIGPYEVLQQGVDYYIDPTNLWIVLVSPIGRDERLAVSYTVTGPDGAERVDGRVGGTVPTTRGPAGRDTVNLLWDNEVLPGDSVFNREIRSAYRLGGDEIQRSTIAVKVVVGSGSDQEKPLGAPGGRVADTYLQLFGLAQPTNSATFDAENRLWPRVGDPNQALSASGGTARLIRDSFIVFPSLRPFSASGLVQRPDPTNDSLYRTPDEDLSSQRRPPTQYRIRARYAAEGSGEAGSLSLGAVQVRPGSERLTLDGRLLQRDIHYRVDYELGRVNFLGADTLFARPRTVSVRFEENPLFASSPTSIFGLATQFPMEHGELNFTALSLSQRTTFTRPPLGFEPQSALLAGVSGNFRWESDAITRALDRLPFVRAGPASAVSVQGEMATSRPQLGARHQPYVEAFEGEGGLTLSLNENLWRVGSQPGIGPAGAPLPNAAYAFPLDSAVTLAWQNLPVDTVRRMRLEVFPEQIDSLFVFNRTGTFRAPEVLLWTTLYPRHIAARHESSASTLLWTQPRGPGRRWRSISQPLSPTGLDLTRVEHLEFYALIDTTAAQRPKNPTLVLDFGDVSENSVAIAPESLTVQTRTEGAARVVDSVLAGRRIVGLDRLDTERDSITRSFDASTDDRGLPGDLVDALVVRDVDRGSVEVRQGVAICRGGNFVAQLLGDSQNNCSVGNRRLDEEDLDVNGLLNIGTDGRNTEQLLRYVIDLGDRARYNRTGRCYRSATDTASAQAGGPVCWVHFRVPFTAPTQRLNAPLLRRMKSVRLTVVSGTAAADTEFTLVPLARLRLVGSPWVKRADRAVSGVGGAQPGGSGFVVAGIVGTQDRDAAGGLFYQSPPGVTDAPDTREVQYGQGQVQINEKSLRLVAGDVPLHHRAEAFYRFPEGDKNFMAYRELRVWARGRNKGWGPGGDLNFYVKIGRDGDNFYMFRTPVNAGDTRDAWLPEVRVDFARFYALRSQLQNAFLRGGRDSLACTGVDSALVARSDVSSSGSGRRKFATCDDGYIVFSTDPGISPPNLAAVQELAVGIVRVDSAGRGGALLPSDSLEVWVDDIRLSGVVNEPGYAGQIGLTVGASDVGSLQLTASRRDENFRQLTEQPSYLTDDQLGLSSSVRLDKLLPESLGLALPLTINYASNATDPLFLSRSDITANEITDLRTPRTSATTYSLSARRLTPVAAPVWGTLLNNLALTASYTSAASRSEFQTGRSTSLATRLDFALAGDAPARPLPGWLGGLLDRLPRWVRERDPVRALRSTTVRWQPAQLRLTTGYVRNADLRESFSVPISIASDTGRRVSGLTSVWRNGSTLELRPTPAVTARWDFTSLRDLRDYGDSSAVVRVARGERERLFGVDVGLERERQMSTLFSVAPLVSNWVRPRFDWSAGYSLLRDPNTRSLLVDGEAGPLRLPRRLGNSQGLGVGATLDLGRGLLSYAGEAGWARRLAAALQPMSVNWRRDLRSSFDGVPFTPSLGYQLGLGGVDDFRQQRGLLATSAGASRNLTVSNSFVLPLGFVLVHQYGRAATTSWSRLAATQSILDAKQVVFPDASLRWNYTPTRLSGVITSVGAQARAAVTKASTLQRAPAEAAGLATAGVRTEQATNQYTVNGSITWAFWGALSTAAGFNRIDRAELRSGGETEARQRDLTLEAARSFRLPSSLKWRSDQLRTRISFQRARNRTFFLAEDAPPRRITDNGRYSVALNADSEVSETLSLSFTLSRGVTFDNNYDRRFTQTLLSTVLHLSFFAGELR